MNWHVPRKADGRIDFRPKRHHGFSFFIMICGFLLPPLAVAVRFGIGKDFFINVLCTICGYFPGHGHNFFIQNIRNNEHQNRTPKWAKRYGLVSDDHDKQLKKSRAWVGRYNDQNSTRQMYDDDGNVYEYDRHHRFEDGDNPRASAARASERRATAGSDEAFYGTPADRAGYGGGGIGGGQQNGDDHSLRRSKSRSSIRSFGRNGSQDILPGSAEADRRRNKNKFGGILGSRKGKADRHTRSERVMHDSDYANSQRRPYDNASFDSIGGSSGARRDSFDGPENVDDTVGKQYARNANGNGRYDSQVLPTQRREPAPVDIMNDNHQF
jgi:uncharacterized membrane protein YqaE (UPF0057 family)